MEQPPRRARRGFSPEFKARTVELIESSGKSIGQVCRELDLTETAARRWVKQAKVDAGQAPGLTSDERAPSWRACGVRTRFCARSARS